MVLNVVGSNPTGHPKKEVERLPFSVSGGVRTHGVRHRRSRLSEAKESLNLRKFPYSNEAYSRFSQITYRLVTTFCLLSSAVKELLLRLQAMVQAERRAKLV